MEGFNVYRDMQARTNGEIYIGVVGPVRSGKSTFIKKFMDTIVIPNIEDDAARDRAVDELPQSASGRTIMTTEPKFIPEQAVTVKMDDTAEFSVRMIDCVGYIVPSALGYIEEDQPRMVRTPWYDEPIPFNMAAEIGTQKVITEHSTIGLVITTDGSISDIPREEYEEAEERVISELKATNRPYIVLLNCVYPNTEEARRLAAERAERYGVPVLPISCVDITEADIRNILAKLLYQFPIREIRLDIPGWIIDLDDEHWLKKEILDSLKDSCAIQRVSQVEQVAASLAACPDLKSVRVAKMNLGSGSCVVELNPNQALFFRILSEKTGIEVEDETALLQHLIEMNEIRKKFSKLQSAYDDVMETGYGIVMPDMEELSLEEPEIIKQNGKFGIRLKAAAPSIHMMRTCIKTEVTPIVGSEQQSEDLVLYLLKEFEENPAQIWESNIFGKSLHELVNEGMHNKLYRMPEDARGKVRETIERIINDGCNGLICIIL
ncbi:MAG: stage IV sporulation protein A [Acutalibacteraceae bacterium]|nr:stage IV sporulation protein A [Acutalibacteraceae bacterium]